MIDCSVIIPVYNAEKTIQNTLCCFNALSGKYNFEIIVIDDGSTDYTADKVEESAKDLPFIKFIKKENGGVSSARNSGIKKATGKYLFFADADDLIDERELEKVLEFAEKNKCEIIISDYETFDTKNERRSVCKSGLEYNRKFGQTEAREIVLKRFFLGQNTGLSNLWNKLYLREFIFNNKIYFDEKRSHGEDWAFNIKCFETVKIFAAVDRVIYTYMLDGSQNYNKYRKNLGYALSNGYEIICGLNKKYLFFSEDSFESNNAAVKFLGQTIDFFRLKNVKRSEKKRFLKTIAVKSAIGKIKRIKNSELLNYNISRKEKLAARLLNLGFIKLSCKLY